MAAELLVTWIGDTDLDAATGRSADLGPIAQAVTEGRYDAIHLLTDRSKKETNAFVKWLEGRSRVPILVHSAPLSSPVDYSAIYERADSVLQKLHSPSARLTIHLSPGTKPMAAVWILLCKTRFPARLIQSSASAGVQEVNVPFEISAEFIPQLLDRSDAQLTALSVGAPGEDAAFDDIVHSSAAMKRVVSVARRFAIRDLSVLIEGESGTGKELMARAIHRASRRAEGPFIAVNCGAVPPELVESEFFGHMKGAFTGANSDRKGHFERAHRGTLFLDEVGELAKPIQVKLLRALQEGEVTPLGTSDTRKVDVRLIAATNRTLIEEVSRGAFREDLFFRIAVAVIRLPPLRQRPGDLQLLVDALLKQINDAADKTGLGVKRISPGGRNALQQHQWVGNVRELLNTLQRAAALSSGATLGPEVMREAILINPAASKTVDGILNRDLADGIDLRELMAIVARHYLQRSLQEARGNRSRAADLLGFANYQTLGNWLDRYGVKP